MGDLLEDVVVWLANLGLPAPANREALERCVAAVRAGGAVPAVTGVLDGVARVGLDPAEHERICGPARKMAERDLGVARAQGWPNGATTVSAALALARRAGIDVFATGGIGGVHRAAETTGDVSADLGAIARRRSRRLDRTLTGAAGRRPARAPFCASGASRRRRAAASMRIR